MPCCAPSTTTARAIEVKTRFNGATGEMAATCGFAGFSSKPQATQPPASGGCVIKGDRSRHEDWIYHVPGIPYYDRTPPEGIFYSEADALASSYRRAITR